MYEYDQDLADLKAFLNGLKWAAAYLLVGLGFTMPFWWGMF